MKKSFICTHENPLRMQLIDEKPLMISEIHLKGFLDGKDMLILSKMSKYGNLRILDMSGVTELNVFELYKLDDGECSGNHIPFYENDRLEEVIFPNVETIDALMFVKCYKLRKVVIPKTLKRLGDEILSVCPNVEEIYVSSDLDFDFSNYYESLCFPNNSFMGSGKRFVSDNEGWPKDVESDCFFAYDGVLYQVEGDGVGLYRYPAGDERTEFVIPDGVENICEYAFFKNRHLKSITISSSVESFEENSFEKCHALETVIFKHESFRKYYQIGLKKLPSLKHIYLYAEDPKEVCFDMFNGLDNLGEVTLHVPRACKKKYEEFEVEHHRRGREKSYLRFHHIEEFDKENID